MATALQVGSILEAKIYCSDGAQTAINTLHYFCTTVGGAPATDQDFAAYLDGVVAPNIKGILCNLATYRGVGAQIISSVPVSVGVTAIGGAGVGSAGATALPKQVSGLTSWYTTSGGRANRGRTYWPFPASADDTGDGLPIASYITRMAGLSAAVSATAAISVGGRTATLIFSIYHRGTRLTTPVVLKVDRPLWATQRKRGSFGRPNVPPF